MGSGGAGYIGTINAALLPLGLRLDESGGALSPLFSANGEIAVWAMRVISVDELPYALWVRANPNSTPDQMAAWVCGEAQRLWMRPRWRNERDRAKASA